MLASQNGHAECARRLLDAKADVQLGKKDNGWTSLMAAGQNGHIGVVELLLERGADASAPRKDGATALSLAEEYGRSEAARLLRGTLSLTGPGLTGRAAATAAAAAAAPRDTDKFAQEKRKARSKLVRATLGAMASARRK